MRVADEAFQKADAAGVAGLLKLPEWRQTMAFAKDLHERLERATRG